MHESAPVSLLLSSFCCLQSEPQTVVGLTHTSVNEIIQETEPDSASQFYATDVLDTIPFSNLEKTNADKKSPLPAPKKYFFRCTK